MKMYDINDVSDVVGKKIVCVGIGSFSFSIIEHIHNKTEICMDYIAIDTNTGSFEKHDEIRESLDCVDLVFIITDFTGEIDANISLIVALIAKKVGALTIPIVLMPSEFEDKESYQLAEYGLEKIKKESDSVIIIKKKDYKTIEDAYEQAIFGIYGILVSSGECDINLDFADVQTIMSHKGMALVSTSEYEGKNAAYEALHHAIKSSVFDNVSLDQAIGVLVHFSIHPNYSMMELSEAMNIIHEGGHRDAEVIFGTSTDENIAENNIKVIIILTGLEKEYSNLHVVNNTDYESK